MSDWKLSTGVTPEDHHDKVHPPDANVNNSSSDQMDGDSYNEKVTINRSGCVHSVSKTYNWARNFSEIYGKENVGQGAIDAQDAVSSMLFKKNQIFIQEGI